MQAAWRAEAAEEVRKVPLLYCGKCRVEALERARRAVEDWPIGPNCNKSSGKETSRASRRDHTRRIKVGLFTPSNQPVTSILCKNNPYINVPRNIPIPTSMKLTIITGTASRADISAEYIQINPPSAATVEVATAGKIIAKERVFGSVSDRCVSNA